MLAITSAAAAASSSSSAAAASSSSSVEVAARSISRVDVLEFATRKLSGSEHALAKRAASRASPLSTFARFLRGHPSPYVASARAPPPPEAAVNVVDFGADPTAASDSSAAFDRAVAYAIASRNTSGAPRMARGIVDLGGVTLSLQGGEYLLSRPLHIPVGVGNIKVAGGTLRAAPGLFPRHRFLIEVGGGHDACVAVDPQQKSCNENVGVEDLMLDGARVANGARLNDTMGGNLGPDLFFVNFVDAGLTLNGGHEVMLHEAWLT